MRSRVLRSALVVLVGIAVVAAVVGMRGGDGRRSASGDSVAMDTFISVAISSSTMSDRELASALDDSFRILSDLDRAMSLSGEHAELKRVNGAVPGEPVRVTEDLYRAVESALDMADITGGAYDPTVGAVTLLWRGEDGSEFNVPSSRDLARAVELVGAENATLSMPPAIALAKRGVRLDLGGIGKGYAAARLIAMLTERGVDSAVLSLGGNIATIGERPSGGAWRIGVQDPARDRGETIAVVNVVGRSVITAGVYERHWEADGESYTHIYDPRTGMPVSGDLLSVTVVADDPIAGDALSTAFMVLGEQRSIELLRRLPAVEAIFISQQGGSHRITATAGLKDVMEIARRGVSVSFIDVR